jgi:hypothetical protein
VTHPAVPNEEESATTTPVVPEVTASDPTATQSDPSAHATRNSGPVPDGSGADAQVAPPSEVDAITPIVCDWSPAATQIELVGHETSSNESMR